MLNEDQLKAQAMVTSCALFPLPIYLPNSHEIAEQLASDGRHIVGHVLSARQSLVAWPGTQT